MAKELHMSSKQYTDYGVIAQEWIHYVKDGLIKHDPQIIGITISVLIVFFTLVIFLLLKRRSNLRRGILLMGICESGKTALFLRLTTGGVKQTYTSIKENTGVYRTSRNKTLKLIDLPGHERLRTQFLAKYAPLARGVVYMVDSVTLQRDIRDVAEYLYTALSDATIHKNCPPFLIACNKQDLDLAKSATPVRSLIEKELNTLRVTKTAALQGTEDTGRIMFLGKKNKDFDFVDLKPIQVKFVECHVTGENDESSVDVKPVEEWLQKVA